MAGGVHGWGGGGDEDVFWCSYLRLPGSWPIPVHESRQDCLFRGSQTLWHSPSSDGLGPRFARTVRLAFGRDGEVTVPLLLPAFDSACRSLAVAANLQHAPCGVNCEGRRDSVEVGVVDAAIQPSRMRLGREHLRVCVNGDVSQPKQISDGLLLWFVSKRPATRRRVVFRSWWPTSPI